MIKNVFDWSEYDADRVKREMLEKIFITALFDYLGIISHQSVSNILSRCRDARRKSIRTSRLK